MLPAKVDIGQDALSIIETHMKANYPVTAAASLTVKLRSAGFDVPSNKLKVLKVFKEGNHLCAEVKLRGPKGTEQLCRLQ